MFLDKVFCYLFVMIGDACKSCNQSCTLLFYPGSDSCNSVPAELSRQYFRFMYDGYNPLTLQECLSMVYDPTGSSETDDGCVVWSPDSLMSYIDGALDDLVAGSRCTFANLVLLTVFLSAYFIVSMQISLSMAHWRRRLLSWPVISCPWRRTQYVLMFKRGVFYRYRYAEGVVVVRGVKLVRRRFFKNQRKRVGSRYFQNNTWWYWLG